MTIEDLFVKEFQELKTENYQLKQKLENKKEGLDSIGRPTKTICAIPMRYQDVFIEYDNPLKECTVEQLEEYIAMSDLILVGEMEKIVIDDGYIKRPVVNMEVKRYPYCYVFTDYLGEVYFAYNPVDRANMVHICMQPVLFRECLYTLKRQLIEETAKWVREMIAERIRVLNENPERA